MMTTTNDDSVTGGRAGWSNTEIYILGGLFMPLFLITGAFAARNFLAERRTRNRMHLLIVQLLVVVVAIARVLHFLFGAYHSSTFLAHFAVFPELLVEVVYSIPTGALLGAFCLELAVFVQVGWAVKLQIKKLVKYTKIIQRYAYVGFALSVFAEVFTDCLLFVLPDMYRIHTIGLQAVQVLITTFILLVLGSTLLTVESVVSQRQCLPSARWSEQPVDDYDMHTTPPPPNTAKPVVSKLLHVRISTALRTLPNRARVTCVAVGVGCFAELIFSVLDIIDLDVEVGSVVFEVTEVLSRCLEVMICLAISQSTNIVTNSASSSDSDNKKDIHHDSNAPSVPV